MKSFFKRIYQQLAGTPAQQVVLLSILAAIVFLAIGQMGGGDFFSFIALGLIIIAMIASAADTRIKRFQHKHEVEQMRKEYVVDLIQERPNISASDLKNIKPFTESEQAYIDVKNKQLKRAFRLKVAIIIILLVLVFNLV